MFEGLTFDQIQQMITEGITEDIKINLLSKSIAIAKDMTQLSPVLDSFQCAYAALQAERELLLNLVNEIENAEQAATTEGN